jgi:hypothetical protein
MLVHIESHVYFKAKNKGTNLSFQEVGAVNYNALKINNLGPFAYHIIPTIKKKAIHILNHKRTPI